MGDVEIALDTALREQKAKVEHINNEDVQAMKAINRIIASELFLNINGLNLHLEDVKNYGLALSTLSYFFEREKVAFRQAVGGSSFA